MKEKKFAVVGNPVKHSRSPQIHRLFSEEENINLTYDAVCVEPDNFSNWVADFFKQGGTGLNITVPFKVDAFHFADQLTRRARQAGAVNTLFKQEDGIILGDNTDGCGLINDMRDNLQWSLNNKTILVLGAGGAVRGILGPLVNEKPAKIIIANRTKSKAVQLARAFSPGLPIAGCEYSDLEDLMQADIIINGTSASLSQTLPDIPDRLINSNVCVYDMAYGAEPTVFLQWTKKYGAVCLADGIGMLVEQAAESFLLWNNVRPDTRSALNAIKEDIKK